MNRPTVKIASSHISSAKKTANTTMSKTAKMAKIRNGAFDFGFKSDASRKNKYL